MLSLVAKPGTVVPRILFLTCFLPFIGSGLELAHERRALGCDFESEREREASTLEAAAAILEAEQTGSAKRFLEKLSGNKWLCTGD